MLNYAMMSLCLSDHLPAEAIVRKTVELGLKGIDWTSAAFRNDSSTHLRKISEDAGLKVVCYIPFLNKLANREPGGLDEMKWELDRAEGTGADKILIPTIPVRTLQSRSENQKRWIEVVAAAAEECRIRNLIPTVENFPGALSPVVTADDFFLFKKNIPNLKLTFDTGNAFTGEDPIESFRRTFTDIVHMHVKDFYVRAEAADGFWKGLDGRYYRPALIGEGAFDYPPMLNVISELGYRGWISVEYEANDYPRMEGIEKALAHIIRLSE